jgi:hypothetical protein
MGLQDAYYTFTSQVVHDRTGIDIPESVAGLSRNARPIYPGIRS